MMVLAVGSRPPTSAEVERSSRHLYKHFAFLFVLVDLPGDDWLLLLSVRTVTDWLLAAVVEQQAGRLEEK